MSQQSEPSLVEKFNCVTAAYLRVAGTHSNARCVVNVILPNIGAVDTLQKIEAEQFVRNGASSNLRKRLANIRFSFNKSQRWDKSYPDGLGQQAKNTSVTYVEDLIEALKNAESKSKAEHKRLNEVAYSSTHTATNVRQRHSRRNGHP